MTVKTPWIDVARRYIGQEEISGAASNKIISGFFKTVLGQELPDETPWCAVFVNACLLEAGEPSTRAALARSFLSYGMSLEGPRVGAIVVFPRGKDPTAGHVGFVVKIEGGKIFVLGGNQSNSVSIQTFNASSAVGYRWPPISAKAAGAEEPKPNIDIINLQRRLKEHGYLEVGDKDGFFESRTRGALGAFKRDKGLPFDDKIDAATLAALAEEPEVRPGTLQRSLTTEADLRAKGSETIKEGDLLATGGKIATIGGAGAAAAKQTGMLDKVQDSLGEFSVTRHVFDSLKDVAWFLFEHWYIIPVIVGVFLWRAGYRVNFLRVDAHKTGANTDAES